MNEQTNQLIKELADKLGTTAEHLWGVLIRQAPISSTIKLTLIAVLVGVVYGLFRFAGKNRHKWRGDSSDMNYDEFLLILSTFAGVILTLTVLVIVSAGGEQMVAGFFNPEYWALKEILKH